MSGDAPELTVEGRLVPFNVWAEIDNHEGHFLEQFAPGSLRRSFADRIGSRLRGYFEHGKSALFGHQPIMDVRDTWEQPDGAWYRATLLSGLPETFIDGLRRGLYGTSIGAKIIKADRVRNPGRSAFNPRGLELRTYLEARAFDISITPRPMYVQTTVALRSDYLANSEPGTIYRVEFKPVELAAPWRLPEPSRRRRDYLAAPSPSWRL